MFQIFSMLAAFILGLSWMVSSHFPPWMSWHSEAVAFLAVLLAGWSGLARLFSHPGERVIALPFAVLPFIGLGLVAVVQRVVGLVPFWGDVWVFEFYMTLCVTGVVLGYAAVSSSAQAGAVADESQAFTLLAFVILLAAGASTVVAFAQVFGLEMPFDWIARSEGLRRPGANLAQPNHLATLLVMGVTSLVFVYQSKKLGPVASGLLLLTLGAGVATTESRTGALSLLALLGWWLLKRKTIGDPVSKWVGIGIASGFWVMFWAWPHLLNVMDLLSYQAQDRALEGSRRLQVWPQLLEALSMRPWTGWGIHQVAAAHDAVVDRFTVSEPYSYGHNLVLDLALWIGVPLTLLVVGVAAIWLWRRARTIDQLLPWYGLAVALPLALHSMLEYPFAYAYFLAPVMFLFGAIEASTNGKPLARVGAKPVAVLFLIATLAMIWSAVEYLEIEEDFRVARFQALRIGSPPSEHHQPRIILFDQLRTLLDATRTVPAPNMSPEAMQVVRAAALHYPWSATKYRYAIALALNGNVPEAERQIRIMRLFWGERAYAVTRAQINELAATQYPQLRQLHLP